MARSTVYSHHRPREDKHAALRARIAAIFLLHKGGYGYRRITLTLHNEGLAVNHKTVERIMREADIKSEVRKIKYRSYKGDVGRIAPNLLQREFTTPAPNRKWVTDDPLRSGMALPARAVSSNAPTKRHYPAYVPKGKLSG